ncbi:hypothetical protein [Sodalis-like endosymbiont of Proechinophthirus fluctus]|uniref:hypothetical protein n=1 Tax=Sodalis-like endosymbiont of Proechinophthirus fluctus TaxID=1462730 RepID=UPI000B15EB51|nr:hypothetical protein [Sodalis-like endosymbiont of Proechinophthirus fluctus]
MSEQFSKLEVFKIIGADIAILSSAAYSCFGSIIKLLKASRIKVASVGIPVDSNNIYFSVLQDDTYTGKLIAETVCHSSVKPKNVAIIPVPDSAE